MIGELIKYFVLGVLLGRLDSASSEWFRTSSVRKRENKLIGALRHLLANYNQASVGEDLAKREFRKAALVAHEHFGKSEAKSSEEKLEKYFAKLEAQVASASGAAVAVSTAGDQEGGSGDEADGAASSGSWARLKNWSGRDKIGTLPIKHKAIFSLGLALLVDFYAAASGGLGAGFEELLYSLIEAPALFGGLLASPGVGQAISWGSKQLGYGKTNASEIEELTKKIEETPTLHLLLSGPMPPVPPTDAAVKSGPS